MGIDRDWTLDARERAKDTSVFSPAHMNHSATRHNVSRRCSRADQSVSFYASRNIKVALNLASLLIAVCTTIILLLTLSQEDLKKIALPSPFCSSAYTSGSQGMRHNLLCTPQELHQPEN